MNNKSTEALMRAYEERQMERQWSNQHDYNMGFLRQMQEEIESHWKFMAWLKMTHPEALIEYKAVQAIK